MCIPVKTTKAKSTSENAGGRSGRSGLRESSLFPRGGFFRLVVRLLSALAMVSLLPAQTSGLFSYTDNGTSVTITGYPRLASGPVYIPASIAGKPVARIHYNAFRDCLSITSVVLPASVTQIGSQAFARCVSLAEVLIPHGVIQIDNEAFLDCVVLENIAIPASVTEIGTDGFRRCASLRKIVVDPLNPNFSSADGVLYNKSGTTLFSSLNGVLCNKNHSTLIQYPQARPGPYAVPATVTSITLSAFQNCRRLTEVTLPAGLATLASSTFAYCHELVRVTLPASLTGIGSSAFFGCASLAGITIPAAVATIEATAFMDCENLGEIVVDPLNPHFRSVDGVLFDKAVTRLIK